MSTPLCGAQRRHRAGTCRQPAGKGTDHPGFGRCSWHGGCAPSGRKAAAEQEVYQRARQELVRLGLDVDPVTDPLAKLQVLAGEQLAWKDTCGRMLNRLSEDELRYAGKGILGEQIRAEVSMWQEAMRQSAALLLGLAKAGTDEWHCRIEERKAELLAGALFASLLKAKVTGEVAEMVRHDYARQLRAGVADDRIV